MNVTLEELKAEALQNPEVRAEYEQAMYIVLSPDDVRDLISSIELPYREIARHIGVSTRSLRALVAGTRPCSYPMWMALERLAHFSHTVDHNVDPDSVTD